MKRFLLIVATGALLGGCQPAAKPVAEAPVQNAVTDYVDRGHATMDRAQVLADAENARLKAQDAQALNADSSASAPAVP